MSSVYSQNALGDQATLDANRYGQLTLWQRQQLKSPSLVMPLLILGLVSSFLLVMGVLFFLPFALRLLQEDTPPWFTLLFLGLITFFVLILLPVLLVPLSGLRSKLRLRRDLSDGYIAQEDGQVIFVKGSGYTARVAGGTLHSMDGSKSISLPPGAYRFFYLPRTRRVLSAERQPLLEPGGPKAGLLLALSQAHSFSLDELDTNRLGHLSGRQRSRLVGKLAFLFVAVLALVLGAIWQVKLLVESSPWGYLVLLAIFALLLYLSYQRWMDLLEGRVVLLEGFVQREEHSSGDDGTSYYYVVNGQKFTVSSTEYQALLPGERYRLYHLPHSKTLQSIEPLP